MKVALLGKKIGMTRVFDESGKEHVVTVVEILPSVVTQLKLTETDGYNAVQFGYGDTVKKRINKSQVCLFEKNDLAYKRHLYEVRGDEKIKELQTGDELGIENFESGDMIDVIGTSIGKGFQGVVKRHNFAGGPKSHGAMFGRVPGSIGQSSYPSRVFKGMKAPGQMGNKKVTIQNLKVYSVDIDNHLLVIEGSIPGAENNMVLVRISLKKGKERPLKVRPRQKEENHVKEQSGEEHDEKDIENKQEDGHDAGTEVSKVAEANENVQTDKDLKE